LVKGKHPGKLLQYLIDTEWIDLYPELKALIGVEQEPDHHPEGVLENHIAHTLNAAQKISERENLNEEDKLTLMLSALCHDLGKPLTTKTIEDQGKSKIVSHGHQQAGIEPTLSFLKRIGFGEDGNKRDNTFWSYKKHIADKVVKLVEFHMAHVVNKSWNPLQIAKEIYPATIKELALTVEADISGRPPLKRDLPETMKKWREDAETFNVLNGKQTPLLSGKDIQYLPIKGEEFSNVLNHVYEMQVKNPNMTKERALFEAEKFVRKSKEILTGDIIKNILNIEPGPEYKTIKDKAWEAQKNKTIKDVQSAEEWLKSQYKPFNYHKLNASFNYRRLQ
jgi:tRNA nucleotidyltransferase (CCA-adding enzyme)